jgi:hypothetical protein
MAMDSLLRFLNLVLAPMQIVATILAFGMGTTFEQATASPVGEPPIIPAPYTFLIWSVIYTGSVCYGIYQFRARPWQQALLARIRPYTASAFAATVCWLISARFNLTALTVVCIIWLAASLLPAFLNAVQRQQHLTYGAKLAMVVPLSIYTGWVVVAVFANMSAFLHGRGLLDSILTPVWWAVIMVTAAGGIAGVLTLRTGNIPFALTVCWALVGILVANLTRTYHVEVVLTCGVVTAAQLSILVLSRRRIATSLHWRPVQ